MAVFFLAVFFAAFVAFLAVLAAFLAVFLVAGVFAALVARLALAFFFDGPAAALASSKATACSKLRSSPEVSFGSDALVSPSVTYRP